MTTNPITHLTNALAVIDRQIDGCKGLIQDYGKDIEELRFTTDEDKMLELQDAKEARLKMEGRLAGLLFARDEIFPS